MPAETGTRGEIVHGKGRTHIRTELMRESLVSTKLQEDFDKRQGKEVKLIPWATLINIGGSSILDRGAEALVPLLDELIEIQRDHPIIVSVGGGARTRHTYEIGLDLGLPIGGLAQIVGAIEEQNSHMVHALLSAHGGVSMCREHFSELPKYLLTGMIPIIISTPPYHFWEPPPREGNLPENGSDLGAYLTAEVLGLKQMIFIKDQKGQYSRDPRTHAGAEFMPEVSVADLQQLSSEDLILQRAALNALNRARHVRQVQVINGLERGTLTDAINGKHVGTIIKQDSRS